LVALLCVLTPAPAALAPRAGRLRPDGPVPRHLSLRDGEAAEPAKAKSDEGLAITDDTEVLLDGRACKYEDVPPDAQIILLDVASDHKVIRKIHFRSKK
jgi:hypothetical protein